MNITIISSIRNLLLQDGHVVHTPLFTIHSHPSERDKIIDKNFINDLGIKARHSFKHNMFTYKVIPIDVSVDEKTEIEKQLNHATYSKAKELDTFLLFLWFIKDNSTSADDTYGYVSETFQCGFSSNHTIYSNSSGGFETVHFSGDEFDRAINILLKYIEICPAKTMDEEANYFFEDTTNDSGKDILRKGINDNSEVNDLQRAITFLSTARSVPYLPLKIAFYMPLLESLFGCGEKYHVCKRVSKRVAYYISKEEEDRNNIIKIITDGYGIRSSFLHGERLDSNKSKLDYLKELSARIDEIVRKALTKIIMEDSNIFLHSDPKDFLNSIV